MDEIVINDAAHGEAIAEAAGVIFNPSAHQVISRAVDGVLYGGVILTDYTGASITMHMAGFGDNWANRNILWAVFNYAFNQLEVKKVFGQVPETNTRALEIDLKLGFSVETRVKDVFKDGDLLVVSMYRDQCRWLRLKPRGVIGGFTYGREGISAGTS